MTEFQVGDRVSVTGVITDTYRDAVLFRDDASGKDGWFFPKESLTLIDRPKRKLRVGSVWEVVPRIPLYSTRVLGSGRYTVVAPDLLVDNCGRPCRRSELSIDGTRDVWREVPVEELEREAS